MTTVTLYVIPASHPARAARCMLEYKRIEARVVSFWSGLHPALLRLHGFRGRTVPALRVDRTRVQGTLAISRLLEAIRPDPPLFPADPDLRREVEEAERWGESVLQPIARRLYRWALVRDLRVRRDLAELNQMPLPGFAAHLMRPLAALFARDVGANDDAVRADLQALPAVIQTANGWVGAGRVGADRPNAADFQIAASVRLLLNFDDLRDRLAGQAAAMMALRLMPDYPGRVPPVFPPSWLPW